MTRGFVAKAVGHEGPVNSPGPPERRAPTEDLSFSDPGRATLGLRVHDGGPSALVVVDGELDVATSSLLQALLDDLLRAKRVPKLVRLVVQTTGIIFVDAAGMSPLLHARAVMSRRAGSFELREPSVAVSRLLSLLALDNPSP